jgi:cell wall-associated NlpC family hydrolase
VLALPASAAAAPASASAWARPSIATVLAHGAFPRLTVRTFAPDTLLQRAGLAQLVQAVSATAPPLAGDPGEVVTMGAMHAALVHALGLGPGASAVEKGLVDAGLAPKADAGSEVAARMLGLSYNHPAADDADERFTTDPATRGEAAYSAAHAIAAAGAVDGVRAALDDLAAFLESSPRPAPAALVRAVGLIGEPYVWGGEWETAQSPVDAQPHGGFDCSGLVWRVLVLVPGGLTPAQIGGRTTFEMAAATPPAKRLALSQLEPGDQVMFGERRGPATPNAAIGHTGLYLGGGWFIHAAGEGVTIDQLSGWYQQAFAFGRRFAAPPPAATGQPPVQEPAPAVVAALTGATLSRTGGRVRLTVTWSALLDPAAAVSLTATPVGGARGAPLALAPHVAAAVGHVAVPLPRKLRGRRVRLLLTTARAGHVIGSATRVVAVPA